MSRDNYNPYRIVGAKKIDVWFYEEGDMRRTHHNVYELIILPLYGVCENSFLDYRHHSDELLELFIQPPYIEVTRLIAGGEAVIGLLSFCMKPMRPCAQSPGFCISATGSMMPSSQGSP